MLIDIKSFLFYLKLDCSLDYARKLVICSNLQIKGIYTNEI